MEVERKAYLKQLETLKDKHIIKVVTGVRRCGKSTLLKMFSQRLRESGVDNRQIQFYNFESLDLDLDYMGLYNKIKGSLVNGKRNYIFLDEIQNVQNFEKLVDGLFVLENTDIYMTGSNAFMLSGDLATFLSGRYMEIKMLPLSFGEYLELVGSLDATRQFGQYLARGGMPQSVEMFKEDHFTGMDYLTGVFNTVVVKDIITREGMDDAEMLNRILRFLFDNIGNLVSPNKIANYIKSNYRTIDQRKVEKIIAAICESYILYPVQRYNIKGKELLRTQQKYYVVDLGFKSALLGVVDGSGSRLENLVYLELLRRGYQVWVGQTKDGKEVDFVAKDANGSLEYYQVTQTMLAPETADRELRALKEIDDHNPKYIITEDIGAKDYDGIKQINVIDWLLED